MNIKKEEITWYGNLLLALLIIITSIMGLFLKSLSLKFYLLQWVVFTITYLISNKVVNDSAKEILYRYFSIVTFLSVLNIINVPLKMIPSKGKIISLLVNIIVVMGYFSIIRSDNYKKFKDAVINSSLLDFINIGDNKKEKPGDMILCVEEESGKKEILPEKDRFLHMLILGPTGSGKTSQIIIPMLRQDLQNDECGITVIEPKGDLAETVHQMAKHYGKDSLYFNPTLPDCPYFNPLQGKEEDVIENMATTFKMLNPDSPQFFQDMNEQLIRNSLLVLKRLLGEKATLIELARLVQNSGDIGRKMVMSFSRIDAKTEAEAKENADVASWFLNDYFNEKSKTYEHCSGLRSQVAKITSNKYLRRVLNPPNGISDVDFVKHLESNSSLAISTAQGALRDLGRFLGYFIILNLQSAVFKRPGSEADRKPHFLYIDEFQTYANPGFADMLTQGRSYRVASHLATQNRALMAMGGGRDGKNFVELVSTNARNLIIFPGANIDDAKYYSEQFGEIMNMIKQKGVTRQKFNPLYGLQQMNYPSEQERVTEQMEARFSPTDIIYREFGEITYCIIKNNSIQTPKIGKVSWIPFELHEYIQDKVEKYRTEQKEKAERLEKNQNHDADSETTMDKLRKKESEQEKKESNQEFITPDVIESDIEDDLGLDINKKDETEIIDDGDSDDDFVSMDDLI